MRMLLATIRCVSWQEDSPQITKDGEELSFPFLKDPREGLRGGGLSSDFGPSLFFAACRQLALLSPAAPAWAGSPALAPGSISRGCPAAQLSSRA